MKSKLQKSIFAFIFLGLVASCSTSNEVASNRGIQKRKYTKGYFIDFNHNKGGNGQDNLAKGEENVKNSELAVEESFARNLEKEVVYVTTDAVVEEAVVNATQPEVSQQLPLSSAEVFGQNDENNEFKNVEMEVLNDIQTANKFKSKTPNFKKKSTAFVSNEMSEDAILYYILAILIPFLAVGLVTDWDITKVVICLLLSFFLWIPGIIYALIVVHNNV